MSQCPSCGGDCGYLKNKGCQYGKKTLPDMLTPQEHQEIVRIVAKWDYATETAIEAYLLGKKLSGNVAQAYLKGFDEASVPLFKAKKRLIHIMGTFDLATGHADTFDELLDSLESELRDVLGHYREALTQHFAEKPVAMLERDPSIGRLRVTYEDAVTELDEGVYPLYTKPQGLNRRMKKEKHNVCG